VKTLFPRPHSCIAFLLGPDQRAETKYQRPIHQKLTRSKPTISMFNMTLALHDSEFRPNFYPANHILMQMVFGKRSRGVHTQTTHVLVDACGNSPLFQSLRSQYLAIDMYAASNFSLFTFYNPSYSLTTEPSYLT
jgi:hypothetical protein